jgi:CTP-dependent riboflavin kinase
MIQMQGCLSEISWGAWAPIMTAYSDVFRDAVGEELFPGTLNVDVGVPILIKPYIWIKGETVGDLYQDLLIEKCKVNDVEAYRMRPYQYRDFPNSLGVGMGGHGDNILEILCKYKLRDKLSLTDDSIVIVTFARDDVYR